MPRLELTLYRLFDFAVLFTLAVVALLVIVFLWLPLECLHFCLPRHQSAHAR